MSFNHLEIEAKWQKKWDEAQCFKASNSSKKPKFFALDMFPYPSGAGLHVGHLASYTPTDIVARYKRAQGFNVLHPMGYDAFGLPAEQYAIQTGVHPQITTQKAIENFRRQLKCYGYSFDWTREVSTCDPSYYKWTQFIFLKLYERGLAYQKEVPVNWCPALKTVLANEEVVDGKSERGGHPVFRVPMKQWMLKITDYAERLIKDLDDVDWSERTKEGQRNWIGKSEGARIFFKVDGHNESIEVFTTRPDTIYGATFLVLAPEHPLTKKLSGSSKEVEKYIQESSRRSEVDRKTAKEKTGVATGGFAINPATGQKIPIWTADYVLMDYGTGAIMSVPAHDERDFEFATKFNLPITRVIQSERELPDTGDGKYINSDILNDLDFKTAFAKILNHIEKNKWGQKFVQYKLRDWLFSRQRYWGEPFPIVHMQDGTSKGVPLNELPVTLPSVADYEPTEKGEPPLARVKEFVNYTDANGKKGLRETDTMPGSAGSSWYFLRYTDPNNDKEPFSFEAQKYWMPVDLYVGGTEHTVGHLLYSRFWHKVLYDCGLVSTKEPFQKLAHQGVVMGPDGQRMSKSRGNVVNPDDIRQSYGADAARIYISFLGPFDKDKPWDSQGIEGVRRFLDRTWRLAFPEANTAAFGDTLSENLKRLMHKTIKKVGDDIDALSFNTAVSAMMILVNEAYQEKVRPKVLIETLAQLLAPFAPHFAEELWESQKGKGSELVAVAKWPSFDPSLTVEDSVELPIQVLGKMRGTVNASVNASEEDVIALAKTVKPVAQALEGKTIVKVIYKAGKILNFIVR